MARLYVNRDEPVLCEGKPTAVRRGSVLGSDFLYTESSIHKQDRDYLYREVLLNRGCLECGRESRKRHFIEVSDHVFAGPLCSKCSVKGVNAMTQDGRLCDIAVFELSVSNIGKDKNYECSPVEDAAPQGKLEVDLTVQLF